MPQYGTWSPYVGSGAVLLAAVLSIIAGVLAYLGIRLHRSIGVNRPGRAVSIFLIMIWCLSLATFAIAVLAYARLLLQQYGTFTAPPSPISPITDMSGFFAFIIILLLNRDHGWRTALGSAVVGTIAAPMIFELPFDLIVMGRLYPPTTTELTLLFFLPLFLIEISSFALLTCSPLMRLSKYTLFALAGMFLVFAIWAWFGFPYPSSPIPIALNVISKILSFAAAVTLFLPQTRMLTNEGDFTSPLVGASR